MAPDPSRTLVPPSQPASVCLLLCAERLTADDAALLAPGDAVRFVRRRPAAVVAAPAPGATTMPAPGPADDSAPVPAATDGPAPAAPGGDAPVLLPLAL